MPGYVIMFHKQQLTNDNTSYYTYAVMAEGTQMNASDTAVDELVYGPAPSPEQLKDLFLAALEMLGETQSSLAARMKRLGDHRPQSTILRSIQRMASGETRVSGEMQVIVELIRRERRRAKSESDKLEWTSAIQGCVRTKTREFTISLSPHSRGRWAINLMHDNGYSPPWPQWQQSLEAAKVKAVQAVDDGLDDLEQIRKWNEVSDISGH